MSAQRAVWPYPTMSPQISGILHLIYSNLSIIISEKSEKQRKTFKKSEALIFLFFTIALQAKFKQGQQSL
jgi:hypothetical protein